MFYDLAIELKSKSDKSLLPKVENKVSEEVRLRKYSQIRLYLGCAG